MTVRRADITLKYSNDADDFLIDLNEEEERELVKLREREEPRLFRDTEDLYWGIVNYKFGKMIEECHGDAREAEYIDALVRFYDGGKEVSEEYYIYC